MKLQSLLAISLCAMQTFAGPLENGWTSFNNNNRSEAKKQFIAAAQDPATKADAYLALSMVYRSCEQFDSAFISFKAFFKASGNPYPHTYALWVSGNLFSGYGVKGDAEIDFLKDLTKDDKANGTLKAMSWYMLGKHYKAVNEQKDAKAAFDKIGALENWQAVGTFENISASGFNKSWGPLAHPEPTATFRNKVNAEVRWFDVPYVRDDKWFDFTYNFATGNSIVYGQTFVTSKEAKEAFLTAGNSGSLKIWLNDKLIISEEEERDCDMDIYTSSIRLAKGVNRILVQIGESDVDNSNVLIRLTDKDGNNLQDITTSRKYEPYSKDTSYTITKVEVAAEDFFEERCKVEPTLLVSHILLAETYLRNDKIYEAKKTLKKARNLAPVSGYISLKLIEAYNRDDNETERTREQEFVKTNDSLGLYVLNLKMGEEGEKENFDEQEKLLQKIKNNYGTSMYTEIADLNLLSNRKQIDEAKKMVDKLYQKYPYNYSIMAAKYGLVLNSGKDLNAGNQILYNYQKKLLDDNVKVTIAQNLFKLGKGNEALEIYKSRVTDFPHAIRYYNDLSDIYFALEDYKNALIWQNKTLEFAPEYGYYYDKLGKIQEAMGDKDAARESYKKAIYYQPTNYSAREIIRRLDGKKELFDLFNKVDVYDQFKKAPGAEAYPEDNSLIVLNDMQRIVYPEGGSEEKVTLVVKVLNKAGIDRWKEYSIGFNGYTQKLIIDKAEVLKADGSKVKAETSDNYAVFTGLDINDGIHVTYRIQNYASGRMAQQFWDEHNFNTYIPVINSVYSLLTPDNLKYNAVVRGGEVTPVTTKFEGYQLKSWAGGKQDAIHSETYMPPLDDAGFLLEVSSIPDWDYVAKWYSDLSSTKAKSDFELKEAVAELFKEKIKLTQLQQAKKIYEFIEDNIRYSSVSFMQSALVPQKASRTISTKLGDCKDVSTLFVAMCKEVGIKANLILIDTRDNGDLDFTVPSVAFNHCIATASLDGKQYVVELTDQKLSFGVLPYELTNAISLVIPREGDTLQGRLKPLKSNIRTNNGVVRETTLSFENNDMTLKRTVSRIGAYASYTRNSFADLGKEKQEKEMTESVSGDFSNPVKLVSLNFSDLKGLKDTVKYDYTYKISNEVKEIIGIKIIKLPFTDAFTSLDFVSLETRKYPFNIWQYNAMEFAKETITVNLPAGKLLAETPASVSYSCGVYDYSLTYKVLPGKLIATRTMKQKADVLPVADYAAFRTFCQNVAAADTKQIGFK